MSDTEELEELKRRLNLYKELEENILTGGAQSYNIGNRSLNRYNVSLQQVKNTIEELEEKINAIETGSARWSGNLYSED